MNGDIVTTNVGEASKLKISFIGLGAMGWPMAANLIKNKFDLVVFDSSSERTAAFVQEVGGRFVEQFSHAIEGCDIVISMLPTSKILQDILIHEKAAQLLKPGCVVVDMCSGVPGETQETAKYLHSLQCELVDAPVSGGVRRAITGQLAIVAGGSQTAISKVEPVLLAMGRAVSNSGPVGSAHAMKALNNLAQAGSFLIALEAMLIGIKFGLSPELLVDYFNESSGMNYNTQIKFKQYILSGTYSAGFAMDLLVKDIGIALTVANETGVDAPFSELCGKIWGAASKELGANSDHTEIAKYSASKAGVALA